MCVVCLCLEYLYREVHQHNETSVYFASTNINLLMQAKQKNLNFMEMSERDENIRHVFNQEKKKQSRVENIVMSTDTIIFPF